MNGSKRNWDGIGWVIFAGAAGGLLSWLYSLVLKQPLCDSVLLSLISSILFGVLAGGTGVYVFKLVDQSVFARTFFIAVLFGFVWKPIIEAIPDYVRKTTQTILDSKAEEIAAKATASSEKLTPEGDPANLKPQIKTTGDEAVKAVATLPGVKSSTSTHQGNAALSTQSYGVANAVSKSLEEVAAKNSDPTIKGQAQDIKKKIDALNAPPAATSVHP